MGYKFTINIFNLSIIDHKENILFPFTSHFIASDPACTTVNKDTSSPDDIASDSPL